MRVFAFTMVLPLTGPAAPIVLVFARVPRVAEIGAMVERRLAGTSLALLPEDYAEVMQRCGITDDVLAHLASALERDVGLARPWASRDVEAHGARFSLQLVEVHGLEVEPIGGAR